MTRRRWIADEAQGNRAALTGEHAAHLARVLRARPGQEFEISVDEGIRLGRVLTVADDRVEFELGETLAAAGVAPVTVLLAVFKFDRLEWALEKLTELGVARVVPLLARRTETHLATAATKRVERWQRLALQASEQSRRAAPPEIAVPARLGREVLEPAGTRIVLAESERGTTLKQALAAAGPVAALSLAIGPEGGWTAEELKLFADHGWTAASLGTTILRAETAAIAAVAIAVSEL